MHAQEFEFSSLDRGSSYKVFMQGLTCQYQTLDLSGCFI